MRIIIDADACPKQVLSECIKIGKQHGLEVITVANFNHQLQSPCHIMVGDDAQSADIAIVNLAATSDIVVTQDWGLAALVIAKGAVCLSPSGREYTSAAIDFLLEERAVKAKSRRAGERIKGPRKRASDDDAHFSRALMQVIARTKRPKPQNIT